MRRSIARLGAAEARFGVLPCRVVCLGGAEVVRRMASHNRRFTQSLRQREPAAMVAPYDRVGLAVRCTVVLSIPGHDQRWRFLSTSSARSACTVITNSLLITSSTVRSVSITNVTRRRGIIGIHPLTPNWRATT